MIRSHERRVLAALLFLVSKSEPASTDSLLYPGCGEARPLRSRIVVEFVVQRIDRSSYICVPRNAYQGMYQALLSYVFS